LSWFWSGWWDWINWRETEGILASDPDGFYRLVCAEQWLGWLDRAELELSDWRNRFDWLDRSRWLRGLVSMESSEYVDWFL